MAALFNTIFRGSILIHSDEQKHVDITTKPPPSHHHESNQQQQQHDDDDDLHEFEIVNVGCNHPAKAVNRLATLGWLLFAFSYVLERHVAFGFDVQGDFLLVPTVALVLVVAFLQTKLLPSAMMHRRMSGMSSGRSLTNCGIYSTGNIGIHARCQSNASLGAIGR